MLAPRRRWPGAHAQRLPFRREANRLPSSCSAPVPCVLDEWNGLGGERRCNDGLLVADDVLGGFFCWYESPQTIHYLAPDTLEWEDLGLGYTDWLHWCFSDNLASFYGELRWEGWQAEVRSLTGDRGLHVWPPLFSKGPAIAQRSRKPVPVEELWSLALDLGEQLRGLEDGAEIRIRVADDDWALERDAFGLITGS